MRATHLKDPGAGAVDHEQRIAGLLLGTAVGDALGLPAEGMSPDRIRARWHGHWRMRFLGPWGMFSDDTEHTFLVAQSLATSPSSPAEFQHCLARRLRWWFAALPAGVGFATARACLRLWLGFPPSRSGVFSAGNGPAMRSALIGAVFANAGEQRRSFVEASTRLTHTDPRAQAAALAVAEVAARICRGDAPRSNLVQVLAACDAGDEWQHVCERVETAGAEAQTVSEFARSLGLKRGVTGYALHSVPLAIYAWWRHPDDFEAALASALDCGGDTDTVGAITGALAGCETGERGIPRRWLDRLRDWPLTTTRLRTAATRLARTSREGRSQPPIRYFWPGVVPRNVLFLVLVIGHGLWRLLPPRRG